MFGRVVNILLNKFGFEIHSVPKPPPTAVTTIRVGNYDLKANGDHALPNILTAHPEYSANLPRLVCEIKKKYSDLLMFDVGANIGDTVALVRSKCHCKIVCIEGDSNYFRLLKQNVASINEVSVYNCFLGEESKTILGTTEKDSGTLKIITSDNDKIDLLTLDEFITQNGFCQYAKLLKIDTDGYDLKILRGALNYISQVKPVLFFEYDKLFLSQQGDDGISTLYQLRDFGYDDILYYDNYGRLLMSGSLNNRLLIDQLDNYIDCRKGAFEYFDLCVFHTDDKSLAHDIIQSEVKYYKIKD